MRTNTLPADTFSSYKRSLLCHAGAALLFLSLCGCATLTPGADIQKSTSVAFTQPAETRLGQQLRSGMSERGSNSGFRIIQVGADGFMIRMQMINAAERALDLQYFIFRGDETGRLLTDAVLRAADRGVRVRVLVDDGETLEGDDQIAALEAHKAIEIRFYNPFSYRGDVQALRALEFAFKSSRLDYRMHNKLLVVDNAIALIGGRNVGDKYFQVDPEFQFADDDVLAVGPVVPKLSATFDEFWNCALSIPAENLSRKRTSRAALNEHRQELHEETRQFNAQGLDYLKRVSSGEPLAGILSGRLPLISAPVAIIYDSPDKKNVENGTLPGVLMLPAIARAMQAVRSEFVLITPYLVPGEDGTKLLTDLRQRDVRVRILTSSLEASSMLIAHSGYMSYRIPLLQNGVELHEIRSLLGSTRGSGQTSEISRFGNYSLHAKFFVFDRRQVYIGTMNFDQRSMHLNTEIGLIIDSPELAQQVLNRFDAMTLPINAYRLSLLPGEDGAAPTLRWHTQEGSEVMVYDIEPARNDWQRFKVKLLSLLPMDGEL